MTADEGLRAGPAAGAPPAPGRPARRPVRSVALYGYLGSGNLGNDASFEAVVTWLRAEHPQVAVRSITIAPAQLEARYGVPSVPLSWYRPGPATGPVTARLGKLVGRAVDVPRSLRLAGTADAVIVPGMGVLEESLGVVPWGLPLWLYLTALACRVRRRPFVLLDVGAERAANPITRWLIVRTAGSAAHLSYRDAWSAESMRRAGARPPDAVSPDLVFAHDAPTLARPEPGLVVVGVMAYYGPDDDSVAGRDVLDRYVDQLTGALARLTDDGRRIVLLGGDRVDTPVAHRIATAVRRARPGLAAAAVTVAEPVTFTEVTNEMARAELVVASRFHNLIAALRLARPVVSVAYAEKSNRLMAEFGLEAYCQEFARLDGDRLVTQLRALAADPSISGRLAADARCREQKVTALMRAMGAQALGLVGPGGADQA